MSDYIKREDALQRFTFEQGNRIPEVDVDNFPITITIKDIKRILRELAAADVAEVRRGTWMSASDLDGCYWHRCSNCEHDLDSLDDCKTYNYCPNCGAKMDKEEQR